MAFKDVMNLRKAGNTQEAYEMAISDYQQNSDDIWSKRALGWCLFDTIKANASFANREVFIAKLSELNALEIPADETMIWNNIIWPINTIVRECSNMQFVPTDFISALFDLIQVFPFCKPSKEYSVLLKAFMTIKEKWTRFTEFCDWWGFDNFQDEDYTPETLPNGRKLSISTVEGAYLAYAKQLINKRDKDAISMFIPKMQDLAEKHPEMQYPNYYIGKMLIAQGGTKEETLSYIVPFVRKKQSEFWAWQLLAESLTDDDEKCMACLLRAVHCHTQEQFLVNLYLILAKAFKQLKYYADARFYLDKYMKVKVDTQAHISNDAIAMQKEDWYIVSANQKPSYELDYLSISNEILFADIPETDAVVSFVNKDKKMATIVYGQKKEGFFKFDRYVKKLNIGDILKIRIAEVSSEGYMKINSVRVSKENLSNDYFQKVNGVVSTNMAKTAYFLKTADSNSYYIPAEQAKRMQLNPEDKISALVLYSYNKKRSEWSWSCLKIEVSPSH